MAVFRWRHFAGEIILWAVCWYCRYGITYRELEEMMGERARKVADPQAHTPCDRLEPAQCRRVDHTTVYRWSSATRRSSSRSGFAGPRVTAHRLGAWTKPGRKLYIAMQPDDEAKYKRFWDGAEKVAAPFLATYMGGYKLPQRLWHYTTLTGLMGIVETKSIWASHPRFLNDSSEMDYGIDLIKDVMQTVSWPASCKQLCNIVDDMEFSKWLSTFVCCFCQEGNLLSQWRAYADIGRGVALGFRLWSLEDASPAPRLFAVEYDPVKQRSMITSVLNRTLQEFFLRMQYRDDMYSDNFIEYMRFALGMVLFRFATFFKHPDFREEKEVRLVYYHSGNVRDSPINFRATNKFMIPYVNLYFDPMPIERLCIGPGPHQELLQDSIEWIFEKNGIRDVDIEYSDTPWRV